MCVCASSASLWTCPQTSDPVRHAAHTISSWTYPESLHQHTRTAVPSWMYPARFRRESAVPRLTRLSLDLSGHNLGLKEITWLREWFGHATRLRMVSLGLSRNPVIDDVVLATILLRVCVCVSKKKTT